MTVEDLLRAPAIEGVFAPQGQIVRAILVSDTALAKDEDLVQGVVDYVNVLLAGGRYSPGEFPDEALQSYYADYYLVQVNNGGHGQFAHNSRMMPRSLAACRQGLVAMGADDYLAIFDGFLEIMASDPARNQAIRDGAGFGEIDPAIRALDDRFFALKSMTAKNAAWLRSLPVLKVQPEAETAAELELLIRANPLRNERDEEAKAERAREEAADPTYQAARACAAQEGVTFERFTAGFPIGDAMRWGAITNDGLRYLMIWKERAEWRTKSDALRAIYFFETNSPYPRLVGDGTARARILAQKVSGAVQPQALVMFYLPALAEFTRFVTPSIAARNALLIASMHCKQLQFIPRRASPAFERREEHSVFRLTIANLLWDLSTLQLRTAKSFAHDDKAAALFLAAGALAAAGADALLLAPWVKIVALEQQTPDDFKRERYNVLLQLSEIMEWHRMRLVAMAYASDALPAKPGNVYATAERLLFPDKEGGLADLSERMAYFEREYAPAALTRRDQAEIIRNALKRLRGNSSPTIAAKTARWFAEQDEKALKPHDNAAAFHLQPPSVAGVKSRSALVPIFSFNEKDSLKPVAQVVIDFDDQGKRKRLSPKP